MAVNRLAAQSLRLGAALAVTTAALGLSGCAVSLDPPPARSPSAQSSTTSPVPTTPAPVVGNDAAAQRALGPVTDWTAYKFRAARLITEANVGGTYDTKVPDPVYAIPVIEVELNADGSVRNVTIMRTPTTDPALAPAAVAAVRRVASFGSVANLPRPWRFSEVFLYNEDKRFQLRTLAEAAGN